MATILQALVIDGQTVWVEVDATPLTVTARAKAKTTKSSNTAKTVKTSNSQAPAVVEALEKVDITKTLMAIVGPVHAALAAVKPEEATVELSLGLKGEVGVFVAKSEGNASLKITAKWKFAAAKPA